MSILRRLAFGFYLQLHRWKRDSDRRLSLSSALATTLVINLISARVFVQSFLAASGKSFDVDVPMAVLVIVMVVAWLVVDKLIITDQVYSEIKMRSEKESERAKARSFSLVYLCATILFFAAALVLAALK